MKTFFAPKSAMTAMLLGSISWAVPSNSVPGPISGYGVEEMQWNVEVSPGQMGVFNGTIQEVYRQVLARNPDYQLPTAAQRRSEIKPRGRSMLCGNSRPARRPYIEAGIRYLRTLSGQPRNGPGPGNCGRISCSFNSAIYWCNDNNTPKTIDGWNWIADSAQTILDSCASRSGAVSGQNFEDGNWNTIVTGDFC